MWAWPHDRRKIGHSGLKAYPLSKSHEKCSLRMGTRIRDGVGETKSLSSEHRRYRAGPEAWSCAKAGLALPVLNGTAVSTWGLLLWGAKLCNPCNLDSKSLFCPLLGPAWKREKKKEELIKRKTNKASPHAHAVSECSLGVPGPSVDMEGQRCRQLCPQTVPALREGAVLGCCCGSDWDMAHPKMIPDMGVCSSSWNHEWQGPTESS